MRRLIPLFLAVVLVAAACGDDSSSTETSGSSTTTSPTTTITTTVAPDTDEGRLDAARERWAAHGLPSYRMTTSEICFCPETRWVNTVVDGEVTDHSSASDETLFDPGPRTMETLFDEIADAIAEGFETLDAEYDPETGAVVSFYVDVEAEMADEEYGVRVNVLTPFDPSAVPTEIDAALLVDDYHCGYGFEKSTTDQTIRLSLTWTAGFDPSPSPLGDPIVLPDDAWRARLLTGEDLFSNWCDDVIEPDEPTPAIMSHWSIVAGTLTITSETPVTTDGNDVTATLTGAVAESSSGALIELDDIDLHNGCWACFAG